MPMYEVIRQKDGTYLVDVMSQSGRERWIEATAQDAIAGAISGAKAINNEVIGPGRVACYEVGEVGDLRYIGRGSDVLRGRDQRPDPRAFRSMPYGIRQYNAQSEPCDAYVGPCCCGAWHHEDDWPDDMREFVRRKDAERARTDEPAGPISAIGPAPVWSPPWAGIVVGPAGGDGLDVPICAKAGSAQSAGRSWLGLTVERFGRWLDKGGSNDGE